MTDITAIRVLLVEDNSDTATLVERYLKRFEGATFDVVWKADGADALRTAVANGAIDIIVLDHFLPSMNGVEVTKALREKKIQTPIVFLTVSRDTNLAVEVMKLGVDDYLVKEDITSNVFPRTLLSVLEKRKLRREVDELEIKKKRLEVMQEMIVGVTNEVSEPLESMRTVVDRMLAAGGPEKAVRYLALMKENIERLVVKMEKLKNLKEDKTVQYIKDIKMIDLS